MENFHSGPDFYENHVTALKTILDQSSDDPAQMERVYKVVRANFANESENLPFPMYNIGRRLIDHAIREKIENGEFLDLFRQFADEPYLLAKILVKKDPDRFFDFLTVSWVLRKTLPEYVKVNEDEPPVFDPEAPGGGGPGNEEERGPKTPPREIVRKIRENLEYLDEEDIFEMAIPLFKQQKDKDKDGFQKGYEELLELLDGVTDPEQIETVESVFDRFSQLIDMEFGTFKPELRRKNFPYITVRRAIAEMDKIKRSKDGGRRFANFDTRTGKTSLAILEPEYLGKKRIVYICPPDTIPTIVNEFIIYGGNKDQLYVARTEEDMILFNQDPGKHRYCIVPSSLVAYSGTSEEREKEAEEDDRLSESFDEERQDIMAEGQYKDGVAIDEHLECANPNLRELFENWQPDYVTIDEARYFTGYHCQSPEQSSKRSRALLYLLNNEKSLKRRMTVRLMDATPGDLTRHFYPILSLLHPKTYPTPEDARAAIGHQPYLMANALSARMDQAIHHQVYDRPPVRNRSEVESRVEMGDAQSAIYDFAAHYSTTDVLHRITLARIATFNPTVLRPAFRKLLGEPMSELEFTRNFDAVYKEWKERSATSDVAFDWDFVARHGEQEFFRHLFAQDPAEFMEYMKHRGPKLQVLKSLYESEEVLSAKAQHVINRLKEIVEDSKAGDRHPSRIVVFSTFKKGLTRGIGGNGEDIPLKMEMFLMEQIQKHVPEVNCYMLDGGISTQTRTNGKSARDEIRQSWSEDEGINVLLAVGPATCQGVDLTSKGNRIEEIHMDTAMDSRLDYQVHSRTLGPRQDRMVTKQALCAVTSVDRHPTIDQGIRDLVVSKYLLRDLICRGVSIPNQYVEAVEDKSTYLGGFTEAEKNGEEATKGVRKQIKGRLSGKKRAKKAKSRRSRTT
jgi:hypothetical protein